MTHPSDIYIPLPLEQELLRTIRIGDQISFNDQPNIRFIINTVTSEIDIVDELPKLRLRLSPASTGFMDFKDIFPDPETTEQEQSAGGPGDGKSQKVIGNFIVYRQPRKLASSRVDMPTGYLIDLRLSGEVDVATNVAFFNQDLRPPAGVVDESVPSSIAYLFNGRGSIDRYSYTVADGLGTPARMFEIPTQPAFLMVREYSTDDGGELIDSVLVRERTMWVTVDPVAGTANVVSGVPVDRSTFDDPTLLAAPLRAARTLSRQGQQAAQ